MTLALTLICLALLSYIAVSDFRSFRVPDHATFPFALSGLLWAHLVAHAAVLHIVSAAVVGAILFALGSGYRVLRKVDGLGFGDVKLAVAGAFWIGPAIPIAVAIGAGLALVVTVLRVALGQIEMTAPIPFGTYLALGIGAVFLLA